MSLDGRADTLGFQGVTVTKSLIIVAALAAASCEQAAEDALGDIRMGVAEDAVKQYDMVKQHGTPVDKCVHAGFVAAAYLQAQDERKYEYWKAVERLHCADAGV